VYAARFRKKIPAITNISIGTNFPIVNPLLTRVASLTPIRLISVRTPTTTIMIVGLQNDEAALGQK
jgi:hypothetical protein